MIFLGYFIFESTTLLKSRKNLSIILLFLTSCFLYSFWQITTYQPKEDINQALITRQINGLAGRLAELAELELEPEIEGEIFQTNLALQTQEERLNYLERNELVKYAAVTADYYQDLLWRANSGLSIPRRYFSYKHHYGKNDGHYAYGYKGRQLQAFSQVDFPVTTDLIAEKSALHFLNRSFTYFLPFSLLIASTLMSMDSLIKEQAHPSLFQALPIKRHHVLLLKLSLHFLISLLLFFLGLTIILALTSYYYQFGYLQTPMPIFDGTYQMVGRPLENLENFTVKPIIFLLFYNSLFLWLLIVTNLSLILFLNHFFPRSFLVALVSFSSLGAHSLIAYRGYGTFREISWHPLTYTQFGNILSGEKNYLLGSQTIALWKGTYLFASSLLLLQLFIYLLAELTERRKHR